MSDLDSFSTSYAEARRKFLAACAAAGLPVQHHVLAGVPGRDGEELAIDVARSGPADAENLLVISSGCHGIEGFCGSGVQLDLLRDEDWRFAAAGQPDLAVLYVHALNPYGFSWARRVTQENVDLNRNFRDFSRPPEDNPAYRAIAPLLLPRRRPPTLASTLGLLGYALRHGRMALQAAISRGQQVDPRGLFFAGTAPTWSHERIVDILREHGQRCRRIGWIDVHTGLGPMGHGERIYKGRVDAESIARARRWWGPQVTSSEEGSSSSAVLGGTLDHAVMQHCAQAEYNGLTLEFGTLPGRAVLDALRAEQWHERRGSSVAQRAGAKQRLRECFYVETDDWKRQVLAQSREVMRQTLAGLAGAPPVSP